MMRDPARLKKAYEAIEEIHRKSFPDMRIGQLMYNLISWMVTKGRDPFFPEEKEFVNWLRKFANEYSHLYREWEIDNDEKDTDRS